MFVEKVSQIVCIANLRRIKFRSWCEDASRQTIHPHTGEMIGVSYLAIAYHFISEISTLLLADFTIS